MEKVRIREITTEQAAVTLAAFEADFAKYNFMTADSVVLERARTLVTKYGVAGLRTLDSIQLATCTALKGQVAAFYTADKLLQALLQSEGLPTEVPL